MKKALLILVLAAVSYYSFAQNFSPTVSINAPGSVDRLTGGYTFAYATSGSPWNGAFVSFGGLVNNYDCQISSDYGPHGGNHISFRTRNGDANSWNNWNEFYHSGNINRIDADFTAKTLYSTNINNEGNLWSKQIIVAMANPWPDYVFNPGYRLPTLLETEVQIKETGHLQGMPSAADIKANGIDLGEMNAKLLQKIEELTLYLIEMKKESEVERLNNSKQQGRIEQQQKQLEQNKKDIQYLKLKLK